MVVNTAKFLSRLNACWPVLVYSVAENGGAFQHTGTHAHTGIETPPFAGFLAGVAEVGGFFGDESVRGLIKADLTNSPTVDQVILEFKVADMSDAPGGYDVNDTANGGVFGQAAFVGELQIVLYTPVTDIEDVNEFAVADGGTIHTFAANALAVGTTIQVDVTTAYNAAVGGWIGFRIEDTEAVLQTRRDAGAVVFNGVCLKLQLAAPNTSMQRLGINLGLAGGNAGWARWLKDMGPLTSFYVANGASGVIDPATGLPTSGDTKLTIATKVGEIYQAGDYVVEWGGAATSNGQTSPRTVAFAGASVTLDFNGPVTYLKVEHEDETPGQFTDTFLARVSHGECLRYMESQRINEDGGTGGAVYDPANPDVRIRTVVGANTFYHRIPTPELIAAISTATGGSDAWVCFHHRCTDSNITDFVGRLAYAGFTGTLYTEYSNEIWNSFPQGAVIEAAAIATGDYAAAPTDNARRQAYYADRSDQIAELAKAGYGNVRGVIASQTAQASYFNIWDTYAVRPLTFIDDLSVSWYFGGPPSRAVPYETAINYAASQLATLGLDDWNDRVKGELTAWKAHADSKSWGFPLYEGGSHFDRKLTGVGKDPDRQAQDHFSNLSQTPEVAAVHATVLDELKAGYGDPLAMLFQDIGSPSDPWSWLGGELVTTSPRWQEFITRA